MPVEVAVEREPLGGRLRGWALRRRNPLIFLAVGLVVVATVGYRIRWINRQELPQVAELGRTEGLKALDQGQVEKAYQLLSKAKAAVETLGGAVEGADLIRQGADEAAILAKLSAESLETILDEASRKGAEEWPAWFDTYIKGRTIIVDANVTAAADASGSGRYELDYRIFHGGKGTEPSGIGRIDATGLRLFELSPPKRGDHVRFGAKLASLRYDSDQQIWFFGLEPASGVFMTHAKALEAFGWPSGDLVNEEDAP